MDTTLGKRMIEAADRDSLPLDHEFRSKAQAFEEAVAGFFGEPQTMTVQQFMGHYARARRAWCDYSGESLI